MDIRQLIKRKYCW